MRRIAVAVIATVLASTSGVWLFVHRDESVGFERPSVQVSNGPKEAPEDPVSMGGVFMEDPQQHEMDGEEGVTRNEVLPSPDRFAMLSELDWVELRMSPFFNLNAVIESPEFNPTGLRLSADAMKLLQTDASEFRTRLNALESDRSDASWKTVRDKIERGEATPQPPGVPMNREHDEQELRRVALDAVRGPSYLVKIEWGDDANYDAARKRLAAEKQRWIAHLKASFKD